jgi:hypothetical protein
MGYSSRKQHFLALCVAVSLGVAQATASFSSGNSLNVNPFNQPNTWMGGSFPSQVISGGAGFVPNCLSPSQVQQIESVTQQGGFPQNQLVSLLGNMERYVAAFSQGNRANFEQVVSWLKQQGLGENARLQVAPIILQAENTIIARNNQGPGQPSFSPPLPGQPSFSQTPGQPSFSPPPPPGQPSFPPPPPGQLSPTTGVSGVPDVNMNNPVNEPQVELFIRFFRERGAPQQDLDRLRTLLEEFLRQGNRTFGTLLEFLRSRGVPSQIQDAMHGACTFVSNNGGSAPPPPPPPPPPSGPLGPPGPPGPPGSTGINTAGGGVITPQTIDQLTGMMQQSGISQGDMQRLTPLIQSLQQRIGSGMPTSEFLNMIRQLGVPPSLMEQVSILCQRLTGGAGINAGGVGGFNSDQIIATLTQMAQNPMSPENMPLIQQMQQRVQESGIPSDILQRFREAIHNMQSCVWDRINTRNPQSCPPPPPLPTGLNGNNALTAVSSNGAGANVIGSGVPGTAQPNAATGPSFPPPPNSGSQQMTSGNNIGSNQPARLRNSASSASINFAFMTLLGFSSLFLISS